MPPCLEAVRLGALLHDVGKIAIPDRVLLKPGSLTAAERKTMEDHTLIGERIVKAIHGIHDWTLACVRHHHERWDGQGYPDRLSGGEIPVLARVVHVAEVFDVLTSATSYVRPVSVSRALEILRAASGEQFDRELVERLAALVVT